MASQFRHFWDKLSVEDRQELIIDRMEQQDQRTTSIEEHLARIDALLVEIRETLKPIPALLTDWDKAQDERKALAIKTQLQADEAEASRERIGRRMTILVTVAVPTLALVLGLFLNQKDAPQLMRYGAIGIGAIAVIAIAVAILRA